MRTFRGAWSLAGLVAGAAGLATSYFVAMAMTLAGVPGRLGGQPGHPAHTRLAGALPHRTGRQPGQAAAAARDLRGPRPGLRLGRPARAAGLVGSDHRVRRAGDGRRDRRVRPTRVEQRRPRPGSGRLRDLAGRPVAPHRAAAPLGCSGRARAGPARDRRPRAGAHRGPHPAQLRHSGRDPRGRRLGAGCRRARGRPRPPPRGGVAAAAPADRTSPSRGCRRRPGSGSRGSRPGRRRTRASIASTLRSSFPPSSRRSGRSGSTARWTGRSRSPTPTWWPAS